MESKVTRCKRVTIPCMIQDLEEEDKALKELRAEESKQRGDECVGEKKYWQALESYNTALENTSSGALKLKVSLNR